MTLRARVRAVERQQERRSQGACPHGVDVVGTQEPPRPNARCCLCGLPKFQIVLREDQSGLPWSASARRTRNEAREARA